MKRKSMQLITGILLAGMIVMAGCGSAEMSEGAQTTDVESVEVPIEENDATARIPDISLITEVTKYTNINDFISSCPKGTAYAKIKLNGKDVAIVADSTFKSDGKNVAYRGRVYGVVGGSVCCIGSLSTAGTRYTLRYADGVLHASSNRSYETYTVSSDGSLIHKDYLVEQYNGNGTPSYYRVERDGTWTAYSGGGQAYYNMYDNYRNAPELNFTIK